MKTILRIILNFFCMFFIFVALFNFVFLIGKYVGTLQIQSLNTNASFAAEESSAAKDAQEKSDYCKNEDLKYISVVKYLGTVPENYYTWNYSENGSKREKAYYIAICSFSLQTGRYPSASEARRLAMIYVDPNVELIFGFISLWWQWFIALLCLLQLFISLWNKFKRSRVGQK